MNKKIKITAIIASLTLITFLFASCSLNIGTSESTTNASDVSTTASDALEAVLDESEVIVNDDGTNTITLNNTSVTVPSSVKADGTTITITEGGEYTVTGTLTDGRIVVDSEDDVTIILDNANITCSYSSPIYIYNAKTATVYLKDGTENSLTDGTAYTYTDSYSSQADEEPNACIYSKDDLVIAGSGSLTVNANFNNGITSKDTLKIESSALTVNAKNNGINGKDNLTVKNATVTVTSGGDALRSTNDTDTSLGYIVIASSTLNITSGEDGIQAETYLSSGSSTVNIKSGGGHSVTASDDTSSKGIKAGTDISIDSGTFVIDSSDDAIHANNSITINDGTFTLTTGDDGIHADNQLTINAGTFTIDAHEGLEATVVTLNNGTVTINASDDGINAAQKVDSVTPTVEINGGDITINMGQGDTDAIDSNGNIAINGGTVNITGQSPFDWDGTATLNGGTVYVNGTQVTELTNQFGGEMGGGMMGGPGQGGSMGGQPGQGGPGFHG